MLRFRVKAPLGGCIFENSIDLEIYLQHACIMFKIICPSSREIRLCYMQTTKVQISLHIGSLISAFVSRKCI